MGNKTNKKDSAEELGPRANKRKIAVGKKAQAVSLPLALDYPDQRVPGTMSGDAEFARKALDSLPGLSKDQLKALQDRINSGYYKDPTVVKEISKGIGRVLSKDKPD